VRLVGCATRSNPGRVPAISPGSSAPIVQFTKVASCHRELRTGSGRPAAADVPAPPAMYSRAPSTFVESLGRQPPMICCAFALHRCAAFTCEQTAVFTRPGLRRRSPSATRAHRGRPARSCPIHRVRFMSTKEYPDCFRLAVIMPLSCRGKKPLEDAGTRSTDNPHVAKKSSRGEFPAAQVEPRRIPRSIASKARSLHCRSAIPGFMMRAQEARSHHRRQRQRTITTQSVIAASTAKFREQPSRYARPST